MQADSTHNRGIWGKSVQDGFLVSNRIIIYIYTHSRTDLFVHKRSQYNDFFCLFLSHIQYFSLKPDALPCIENVVKVLCIFFKLFTSHHDFSCIKLFISS
jgi:hypothetical protein